MAEACSRIEPGIRIPHQPLSERADEIFRAHEYRIHCQTDQLFMYLLIVEYAAAIVIACTISPYAWAGLVPTVHPHVYAALLVGGLVTCLPVYVVRCWPGAFSTRCIIAIGQMLMSALLIHLSAGRLETHFHIFGSLAFLSFYRDWRVFIPATIVVAVDHAVRGVYFPYSVYGVLTASPWRSLEHSAWVIFENLFLMRSCLLSVAEMREIAEHRARLEQSNELAVEQVKYERAQKKELSGAVDALGQVLRGIGHQLRTPLASIRLMSEFIQRPEYRDSSDADEFVKTIHDEVVRLSDNVNDVLDVAQMNSGLSRWHWSEIELSSVCSEALSEANQRVDHEKIRLECAVEPPDLTMKGDKAAVKRMLANLLSNACKHTREGTIALRAIAAGADAVQIEVNDTGEGMPVHVGQHLGQPFALNAGNVGSMHIPGKGLGLAICKGIVSAHGGAIAVETAQGKGTSIKVTLRRDLENPQPVDKMLGVEYREIS